MMNSKTLFYVLKRIGLAILTIWVVITITFFDRLSGYPDNLSNHED